MIKLLQQLKTVRLGVWILCVFIIYVGGTVIDILTTPMSAVQMQRKEDHYYQEHYNKIIPGENLPIYDYKKLSLIKKDGRYFLLPRGYWSAYGFHFFWPKEIQASYSSIVTNDRGFIEKRNKATIEVFMDSKINDYSDFNALKVDLRNPDSCNAPIGTPKRWNGLVGVENT